MPSSDYKPSFVRVQRVATILAEDQVLSKKLSGQTETVERRDGFKKKFPVEAAQVAQAVHADGRDVASLGRAELLKAALAFFNIATDEKEPFKSLSDKNSESVQSAVAALIEHAIEIEKARATDAKAGERLALLTDVAKAVGKSNNTTPLLPVYSVVMSAATLVDVDKTLSKLVPSFKKLHQAYREVVVID